MPKGSPISPVVGGGPTKEDGGNLPAPDGGYFIGPVGLEPVDLEVPAFNGGGLLDSISSGGAVAAGIVIVLDISDGLSGSGSINLDVRAGSSVDEDSVAAAAAAVGGTV